MTWIKICGITNLDDALAATDAGANALGFVFHPKSPRHVTLETARSIVAKLPQQIEKVGVFVNQTADQVRDAVKQVGLTAVQLQRRRERGIQPYALPGTRERIETPHDFPQLAGESF